MKKQNEKNTIIINDIPYILVGLSIPSIAYFT